MIEFQGFDFEKPHLSSVATEPLFEKIRQFLNTKGVNRNEYALGSQAAAGFGELVIQNLMIIS